MGEVHADNVETSCDETGQFESLSVCIVRLFLHTSAESVDLIGRVGLGPWRKKKSDVSDTVLITHQIVRKMPGRTGLTNGANDGSTAEVLRRDHLGVELGVPLQLHPVAEMVEGAADGHFV